MSAFVKTGLIGHPVGHSKSPLIHAHWIAQYGLRGSYEAIDVDPESLPRAVSDLVRTGYAGFNVTIPHKTAVRTLCATLDESALRIGAVNTVVIGADGALHGKNTDSFGFAENLRAHAPDFDVKAGPALVLGAGGAARAVVDALLQNGCPEIFICNRTREHAQSLARESRSPGRVIAAGWDVREGLLEQAALLVNATSLGMKGQTPLDLPLDRLPESALVTDIVYTPLETELLCRARRRGNRIVTGIGMLLHQARPAFAAWHGIMPDVSQDLMQKVLA